jgi:hypothetical protein
VSERLSEKDADPDNCRTAAGCPTSLPYSTASAETPKFPGRKPQNISAFALTYILLRRSCKLTGAFIIHPCLPVSQRKCKQQGPFAPRTLLRFFATLGPSATLSSSTDFLGSPVIRFAAPPISRRDEEGFSSCLAHPCHRAAANTPPECLTASVKLRRSMLPSPFRCGLGPWSFRFSRPPMRSLALRPDDSLTIPKMALSIGFIRFVSSANAIQATGS